MKNIDTGEPLILEEYWYMKGIDTWKILNVQSKYWNLKSIDTWNVLKLESKYWNVNGTDTWKVLTQNVLILETCWNLKVHNETWKYWYVKITETWK